MIDSTTMPLAEIAANPHFAEAIRFILVGFVFVTLVLLILAGVTSLIGLAFKGGVRPAPEPDPATVPEVALTPPPEPEPGVATTEPMDAEEARRITAVVAAALHTIMGAAPHRIVSIRPAQSSWAQEGRRNIFLSHRVR